ncbi:MAG: hypothetical protein GX754_00645 [Clostridiaceae bacterium]|nr:hypothetical protein [Clostridiaceae bacterium]
MKEDLGVTIKQLASMLDQDKIPENLKELISLFSGMMEKNSNERQKQDIPALDNHVNEQSPGKENTGEQEVSPEMITLVKTLMGRLDIRNDPRINLLMALKPFLNNNRRKKLGNCIKLLQITRLFEDMENLENHNL